jgi:Domain of unknown function (DUF4157)/Region found in RelA / SpoT proteins
MGERDVRGAIGMTPGRGQMSESDDHPVVGKQTLVERWNAQAAPIAVQLGVTPTIVVDDDARARTEAHGSRGLAEGNNVYLHPEALSPDTEDGRRVLMHELVHVAQARNAASPIEDAEAEATALSAPGALRAPSMGLPSGEAAADTGARAAGTSHGLVPSNYELVFRDTVPHVESEARNVRFTNPTAHVIEVGNLELAGPHAADFVVGRTVPIRVAPGDSIEITVRFRAADFGTRTARLLLDAGVLANPVAVVLFGIASRARWERAATAQVEAANSTDKEARSSATNRLRHAGYSLDEINQVSSDMSGESSDAWRPTQPNLRFQSEEYKQLIGSLYPDYEDPERRRNLLFDRFAQFRRILEGRITPTQRPSVPSGLRLVRAAFEEHSFSDDELSVLWAIDRHARAETLARDGGTITNEMMRKRVIRSRLEAGRALQTPGGTAGYAFVGIFSDDEDRKLAAAGLVSGASNLLGGVVAKYGPRLNQLFGGNQTPAPRLPEGPPMEPDKPDKATHIRGQPREPWPPAPDGRQYRPLRGGKRSGTSTLTEDGPPKGVKRSGTSTLTEGEAVRRVVMERYKNLTATDFTGVDDPRLKEIVDAAREQNAEVQARLRTALDAAGVKNVEIQFREKSLHSLFGKLKETPGTRVQDIKDLSGLRVNITHVSEANFAQYEKIKAVIQREFGIHDNAVKDYNKKPNPWGYTGRIHMYDIGGAKIFSEIQSGRRT